MRAGGKRIDDCHFPKAPLGAFFIARRYHVPVIAPGISHMRVVHALLALAFLLIGAAFAALNTTPIAIDFYFVQVSGNAGFIVLAAILTGAVLGAVAVIVGGTWPLRRRLKALQRERAKADAGTRVARPADVP